MCVCVKNVIERKRDGYDLIAVSSSPDHLADFVKSASNKQDLCSFMIYACKCRHGQSDVTPSDTALCGGTCAAGEN